MDATEHTQSDSAPVPLDDRTSRHNLPDVTPDSTSTRTGAMATMTEGDGHADRDDQVVVRLGDIAQRLKPVAIVAENAAGKAVDLSVRGLARLSEFLERRRHDREQPTDESPTAD